jgi:hypothetical protein
LIRYVIHWGIRAWEFAGKSSMISAVAVLKRVN